MQFYTIGAVRQLVPQASEYTLRRLCELGMVDAKRTTGGRWRISSDSVDKLKREGIPPLPVRAQAEPEEEEEPLEFERPLLRENQPGIEAPEVKKEITRYHETVQRTRRKTAQLQEAEIDDQWKERRRRQEEERREELDRQSREAAGRRRQEWEEHILATAMSAAPKHFDSEACSVLLDAFRSTLKTLPMDLPANVLSKLLEDAGRKALQPYFARQRRHAAIESAVQALPFYAAEDWRLKARKAAAMALQMLGADASAEEIELAVVGAVQPLIAQCKRQEAINDILGQARLWGADKHEQAAFHRTLRAALEKAPEDADRDELRQLAEQTKETYQSGIDQRKTRQEDLAAALDHADEYLSDPARFEWNSAFEKYQETEEIQRRLRPLVIERQRTKPGGRSSLFRFVERFIDEEIGEDEDDETEAEE